MDMITLAMAKAYTDSKGGYTEKNTFSWDGNTEGKVVSDDGAMVKVSDKTPDANTIVRVKGLLGGAAVEFGTDDCDVVDYGGFFVIVAQSDYGEFPVACVCTKAGSGVDETGLYLMKQGENYVTYIEFAETIHPIDPKYLPGMCLPVVELSTTVESGATFTDAENTALNEAFEKKSPIALRCNIQMGDILATDCRLACVAFSMPNTKGISASFGAVVIEFYSNNGGAWSVNVG